MWSDALACVLIICCCEYRLSGREDARPGKSRGSTGSIPGWGVIFRNKFFTIFGGNKGLGCLLASLVLNWSSI